MTTQERAALYRQRSAEFEAKAQAAQSEHMRRSWLILARDWKMMALDAELKELEAPEAALSPDGAAGQSQELLEQAPPLAEASPPEESLEDALARLANASVNSGAA
jgi:hypothetical protein